MIFLGVDPGASGAAVELRAGADGCAIDWCKAVVTEADYADYIRARSWTFAVVEKVQPMPRGMGGVIGGFKLGMSYGFIRGCLHASKVPFEEVRAREWQKAMGIPSIKDEGRTAHKNRTKARAQQLFPGVKVTHAIADAMLLAEYARRLYNQRNGAGA